MRGGRGVGGASKGLSSPFEGSAARLEEASEPVSAPNMARARLNERLMPKDNRHGGAVRLIVRVNKTPFFQDLMTCSGVASPLLEAPAVKPLPRDSVAPSKGQRLAAEDQDQEQE